MAKVRASGGRAARVYAAAFPSLSLGYGHEACVVVAPATYNTINKWAQGISDTYALGVLAEITGLDVPIVVLPFVNSALASRLPFRRSVETLRSEGVRILLGPDGFEPHPPRTGGSLTSTYPWHLALDEADRLAGLRTTQH